MRFVLMLIMILVFVSACKSVPVEENHQDVAHDSAPLVEATPAPSEDEYIAPMPEVEEPDLETEEVDAVIEDINLSDW